MDPTFSRRWIRPLQGDQAASSWNCTSYDPGAGSGMQSDALLAASEGVSASARGVGTRMGQRAKRKTKGNASIVGRKSNDGAT